MSQEEGFVEHDHRAVGRDLDLFSVSERVGPGLVLWHPRGARVRLELEDFWRRRHLAQGYELVYSPHVGRSGLWETSGHLEHFTDAMFSPMDVDGQSYYAKPMNCPFHMEIFSSRRRSYRELPMRLAELGTVYRYEKSGVLHGLLRVRGFTQDDAHVFCRPDQLESEIVRVVELMEDFLKTFRFESHRYTLGTRPAKAHGDSAAWDEAVAALRGAMGRLDLDAEIDDGGGAFYGPKLDVHVEDANGRSWQISTVQCDFSLPERFELAYVGSDGRAHRPRVLHRALFGSLERFVGILLEHYRGQLPVWLAPIQARVLPVAERHGDYAGSILDDVRKENLRVELDDRSEPLAARVRDAALDRVPYVLVVGDAERDAGVVAVRYRGNDEGPIELKAWLEKIREQREAPEPRSLASETPSG